MGTGSKKNKKQAMRRQRKLNPTTATSTSTTNAEASSSLKTEQSTDYFSSTVTPSSLSGCRVISEPITPSNGTFDDRAGLSKLQLRPSLDDYLEKYDLSERSDSAGSSIGVGAPTWESNKVVVPPTTSLNQTLPGGNGGGLLLRNSSTLSTGQKNRNILNDQDDDGFVIDRESMFDPTIHLPHAPKDWKGYEAATPLSDFLMQRIGVSGQPISTAEYMRHALTHPLYGYYTSKDNQNENDGSLDNDDDDWDDDEYGVDDKTAAVTTGDSGRSTIFGRGGDFVTAPELSSVFGHSLCVWFMTVWQQEPLGKPPNIQFVELGPGRGTLMADLLELAHSSKLIDFGKSIRTVHLVEASRELRHQQRETLENAIGHLVRLEFTDDGLDGEDNGHKDDGAKTSEQEDESSFVNTIRIEWHDNFSSFQSNRDKSVPTMVVMQEFLDALPVHQFQRTDDGWRERMIDVVSADETNEAGEPVPTTISTPQTNNDGESTAEKQLIPRLRQVLAPNVTPAVDLLLSSSYDQYDHFPEGTVVEICPDALFLIQDVAKVLEESEGAALIVDYGEEGTTDTLRAFSRHQQVPLTSRPGQVDVTADVDFFALKNCLSVDALKKNKDESSNDDNDIVPSSIHAFGPVVQGEFLMKMGAGELTMSAIEKDETTEEQAQAFADALKYLVMPEHMGEKFKVLALSRKRDGLFGPAGIE
jgi:NADH dehydrogenase [ubiquinone] 1 alpha subcomplex assembly factor 7